MTALNYQQREGWTTDARAIAIYQADLNAVFRLKYGALSACGWAPRMRRRFGYFSPDDHYEALLFRLVAEGITWLDVGCGRRVFPSNPALGRLLSRRARLVGLDPDPTLDENPFVHERVRSTMETFKDNGDRFDLVTMRMVAEHVTDPGALVSSVARVLRPGGVAVVYTVHRLSPIPVITSALPFACHQPIKRILWNTDPKDTFPTKFRMNTRRRLRQLFSARDLDEVFFMSLDDCRTLARLRPGLWVELLVWRLLRALGLPYPERCLLGVYRKQAR